MFGILLMLLLSPINPLPYEFLFDVTHSSLTEFNFTATTNIDGTSYFHYKYNLGLNITVRKPYKSYDFVHYDDVKVMAFYKNKRFALVDLNSFYGGKELTNTTDLLSLAHSLKGQYDVLVIDHPARVDGPDPSKVDSGGAAAITDDDDEGNMVARLYYSLSPPRNTTWPDKTIYSKEELEFKCELELKFPLINGQSAQHSNTSLKTIQCEPYFLAFSCKYYLFLILFVFVGIFILILLVVFVHCVKHYHNQPADDPIIHDSIPLKQPLLQG